MHAPRVPTPERWLSACASPPYSTRHRSNLRASGEYPLQAQRLGFETVTTEALELHGNNIVDVVIRMSSEAMALDPLEVIGRGGSEINRATFEGLYQRRARSANVGTTRIWVRSDQKMNDGLTVLQFLRWYVPTLRCPDFLVRGISVPPTFREVWTNTPLHELEELEVYRRATEAPPHSDQRERPQGGAAWW